MGDDQVCRNTPRRRIVNVDTRVTNYEIQPWGRPPTPLLPKTLVAELGHIAAPSSLRDALGLQSTLNVLSGDLWEQIDSVSDNCLKDIVELVRPLLSSLSHLSIRSGEPLKRPVQDLPFSTRTRNTVSEHLERFTARRLTFGDVLSVPSVGARCAIEFACVVEAAMDHAQFSTTSNTTIEQPRLKASATPQEIKSAFQTLAAYAAGERNLDTLAEVLPTPQDYWPPEIKHLWRALAQVPTREIAGDLIKRYSVPELMSRALAPLDDRLREILAERVFVTERAVTLEVLGERFGITRERVRQIEKKAVAHLDRLRNSEFRPVIRRAHAVRAKLGVGVPADDQAIAETLTWATTDIETNSNVTPSFARALLLWLAGPYKKRQDWLLAERHLKKLTLEAVLDRRDERGMVATTAVNEVLAQFGFKERFHEAWLVVLRNFLAVEGGHIYFKGSILDKVRALLRYHGRPLTVEEMLEHIGSDSVRSVRQRLTDDPGFWRVNKQSEFVIAGTPGYDEYTGITDEIVQEIGACGGEAPFDHLVEKLTRVYGVKETSVVAYINTPMFTKDENGIVRVRDADISIDVSTDITKTAACYQSHDGTWYWRVLVDKDVARGSGRLVPNAFAQELGCNIGDKIEVDTTNGPLTFSWPLASTTGASIGSLRSALASCQAEIGDFLFVRATKPKMTFERLSKEILESSLSDLGRLSLLVGCGEVDDDSDALERIATVLGNAKTSEQERLLESRRILNARGETELAELIPAPTLSMDDYVANMGKLFDQ